ncbi:LuxR family transcriptional regulator [Saccharopolyspora erythraea]|uniref:helix-turn-helix transcriptional regulator n=1 Tax=Saccharopolyspora erythraea TaxID=1836 RepID=UPI001BA71736|nr:helix-turn-helix transcriptional regulator [Saccharopolyspora erythraea]QUH03922.1 LuxR family transcriptional regulator [Saccharopolyspora erythraea]
MIPHSLPEVREMPARLTVLRGDSSWPPVSRHARVDAKLAAAQREVLVVSSLSGGPGDPVAACRRIDHANLRRGVRYRMLCPDHVRTAAGPARRLGKLAQAGAEIRTIPAVPIEALVVDGAVAIVPDNQRGRPDDIAVLHLPTVAETISELVEHLWPAAVPLVASDLPDATELAGRDRELLTLLSAGCTDESAAAALGVSVRTVRRMVSSLMSRLGARSRFQAGVKAADRGWLTGRAS